MYYDLVGLCPRTDIDMGRHEFIVKLYPEWKELVAASEIDADKAAMVVKNMGRAWLDACGYSQIFDIDNCGLAADPKRPPGPNARPLYGVESIRLSWGEWGIEHLDVPGNACGLDIDRGFGCPRGGRVLLPHNIDSVNQKLLLLVVFTWFAEAMTLERECKAIEKRRLAGP